MGSFLRLHIVFPGDVFGVLDEFVFREIVCCARWSCYVQERAVLMRSSVSRGASFSASALYLFSVFIRYCVLQYIVATELQMPKHKLCLLHSTFTPRVRFFGLFRGSGPFFPLFEKKHRFAVARVQSKLSFGFDCVAAVYTPLPSIVQDICVLTVLRPPPLQRDRQLQEEQMSSAVMTVAGNIVKVLVANVGRLVVRCTLGSRRIWG